MASSNKAHDPAAAALLAIEEALNLHATGEGAEPGEAPANPIGAAGADKTKGRVPGDRETAAPHPETSRRARDSMRTPEPSLTAINEDRLLAAARANAAQVEERPVPEQSGVTAPSIRPANDDRQSAGEICARFRPVTIGVRQFSPRPVRYCGLSFRSAILSPTARSFSIFRPGLCCLRSHSLL